VGLTLLLLTADADSVANPRPSRTSAKQLTKANQRVSRPKQGRHRRATAAHQCARQQRRQHLRRQQRQQRQQRMDFDHQTALALVRAYDLLVRAYDLLAVEAIHPANLRRRPAPPSCAAVLRPSQTATAALHTTERVAGLA
jgi:transposase